MELYQKVYVSPDFLETDHGGIPCRNCHGGNPDEADRIRTHKGLVRDPTLPFEFIRVRQIPVIPETFRFYTKNALTQGQGKIPKEEIMKKILTALTILLLAVGLAWASGYSYTSNKDHLGGNLTPAKAYKLLEKNPDNTFLVDCRTRAEYLWAIRKMPIISPCGS